MAISFVGAGTVATGANPTVDVPAGVQAEDVLLIFFTGTATPSTPIGWLSVYAQGAGRFLTVFLKTAAASESSVTLSTGSTAKAVMLAYRGTSYFDVIGNVSTGTSTSPATTSLTTRFANDYVISFYATQSTAATWTAPASTTERVNSGNTPSQPGMLIVDELQAVAGATTARTATQSISAAWSAIAISFKEPQAFYVDPENGADANTGQSFAAAFKNISGATSAKGVSPGDTVRVKESPMYDTGVNATWTSGTSRGTPLGTNIQISTASNASPIVITTAAAHGYSTGDVVQIQSVTNNTNANGIWKITVTGSTTFSLDDSFGNGSGSNGVVTPIFSKVITTASALVQPIASFAPTRTVTLGTRTAWTPSANVTAALTTTIGRGAYYDTITIAAGFTTGKIAYYTLPATLNLSSYQQLSLFIQQSSGTTLGGLTISLCSDTLGNTAVDTFTIPSTGRLSFWCPFTINKGSALGASIQSISISRAANNGAQTFFFNSIVAVKSSTSVDALSNTSIVTKNNGTDPAFTVNGFTGADGTIVLISGTVGSSGFNNAFGYYGTTETVPLYRIEPRNPYILNSAVLPSSTTSANSYCAIQTSGTSFGSVVLTYSGGWDSTNMSTRTGDTWFTNNNYAGFGLNSIGGIPNTTFDRLNYVNAGNGFYAAGNTNNNIISNCELVSNSTCIGSSNTATTSNFLINNCKFTNSSTGLSFRPSNDIDNPTVIDGCIFTDNNSGTSFTPTSFNDIYINVLNSIFNTCDNSFVSNRIMVGNISSCEFNYFASNGVEISPTYLGVAEDLTFTLAPYNNIQSCFSVEADTNSVYDGLPNNAYGIIRNLVVNPPVVARLGGNTVLFRTIINSSILKIYNSSLYPTPGVTVNIPVEQISTGTTYFYETSGITSISYTGRGIDLKLVNSAVYSQDENGTVGNNKIYSYGGLITSQTAVRYSPTGYAWSMAPTSTSRITATYPMKLKIASIACTADLLVTVSAWMRRTNTGLTMQLVCPGGQPYGPSTDTVASMSAAADTWEQVTITFTPTENAVFDIYAYAYGGTTFTGYVDDLEVSQ